MGLARYWPPILEAAAFTIAGFVIPNVVSTLIADAPLFYALGGLGMSLPLAHVWVIFQQPILQITGAEERLFNLSNTVGQQEGEWLYACNRVIVENVGRSAAKNCKGWVVVGGTKERVLWTVPRERPNATVNVGDSERLDFCAYYREGPERWRRDERSAETQVPQIISPTEEQWNSNPLLNRPLARALHYKVVITSENAKSVEGGVTLGDAQMIVTGSPAGQGRSLAVPLVFTIIGVVFAIFGLYFVTSSLPLLKGRNC